jgi:TolB-like protein/DNA-binding winged helix-turn-helix (wHTH) protein
VIRFATFEVDLRSGELRRDGLKIRLQEQPFRILAMLLERPAEVISREEIRKKLWSEDTFVDFDHSLATAVKKLREALGDDADNPRFVETLPRRGYRFIAPVEPHHPLTPSSERRGVETGSPPSLGGGQEVVAVRANHESPLRKHWQIALAAGALLATFAVLLTLNVAGLRERLMTAVGAGSARPREGRALPYPKIESIAVLPLENLSSDPEQEYFADGMTEALINDLGKISALRVISRTSVMHFKGARPAGGLREIARQLTVDAVVEGSLLRSGDRVRVTAQLVQADPERTLWSESYERDLKEILALQNELARAIAREVHAKLTPGEQQRLATARPVDPEVHQAYLQGRVFLAKETQEGLDTSLKYFQQAIAKDPSYAPAYVGLAEVYESLANFHYMRDKEAYGEMKAAALKALELDDTLAQAHSILAFTSGFFDYDQSAAERSYQRAIELNPSFAEAHCAYAFWLTHMGRHQEMMAQVKRCDELDPLAAARGRPEFYYWTGSYDRALEEATRLLSVDPSCGICRWFLGLGYEQKVMYEEAAGEFKKAYELTGESPLPLVSLAHTFAVSGRKTRARKILAEVGQRRLQGGYVSSYDIAVVYAGLGEKDTAFQWLEKAYEERAGGLLVLKVDPRMVPLRSDPRFQDLLRRMNFPP